MTKVAQRSFMAEFEILLARTWETQSNTLSDRYVQKTREAIASIREYYTFKKQMPSKMALPGLVWVPPIGCGRPV